MFPALHFLWLAQSSTWRYLLGTNPSSHSSGRLDGSKLLVLGMVIQPLIGNPYNGYINPYYWVDYHPLLCGNNVSLDPSTYDMIGLIGLQKHNILENLNEAASASFFKTKDISPLGASELLMDALL